MNGCSVLSLRALPQMSLTNFKGCYVVCVVHLVTFINDYCTAGHLSGLSRHKIKKFINKEKLTSYRADIYCIKRITINPFTASTSWLFRPFYVVAVSRCARHTPRYSTIDVYGRIGRSSLLDAKACGRH